MTGTNKRVRKLGPNHAIGKEGPGIPSDRSVKRKSGSRAMALSISTTALGKSKSLPPPSPLTSLPLLVNIPNLSKHCRLPAGFFEQPALTMAPLLLGKLLKRDDVILKITEVEAYTEGDTACHARFGKTARTAPLFGLGGHAYVYLCYGIHSMLNVTADKEGIGAACLIRACQPVAGLETIQKRRGMSSIGPQLLTGPGKVGQALGLTTEWTSHPLYTEGGLELLDGPKVEAMLVGPRVGIDYAESKDVDAPWRFAMDGTPWVSSPRKSLRPLI